ncbi:putative nuclease HARBI1 [Calliphora vicina]|uniref:putative nuclease HARBI1 n=1 Tax=Calliphora vicina TaxID=7373 RepID=UPI00325A89B7
MSTAVPPKLQLAATLSLLAGGSFQYIVGNDYLVGMCQSTVCKYVNICITELEAKLCPEFIKFDPQNSYECMNTFMTKYKIPGVIGCVDGTHFGLQRPSSNEHMFFNRKGFHSLNYMVICDHEYKILAINSKYGGAAHDSFVWKHSDERSFLEELFNNNTSKNVWLLGDSGYPLEPWCITPYRNPAEGSMESNFNDVHSKARCIIERTIGILKGRWKILVNDKRSRYSPEKIASFGNVCAALHNVCIHFKVPRYTNVTAAEPIQQNFGFENETNLTKIGNKIRDHIKLTLREN